MEYGRSGTVAEGGRWGEARKELRVMEWSQKLEGPGCELNRDHEW